MAKITRATQKIFGDNALEAAFTVFGTAKDNPDYSKNVEELQDSVAYGNGWSDAVDSDVAPYMEDTNGFMYVVTSQLAYILQQGAAIEYDDETTYYTGSIVVAEDGSGTWYKSIADDNLGNPLNDSTKWQQIQLAKNGTPLFTQITTDYVLSGDDAIGWAMQGSQVQRSVYPDAYDKISSLYSAGSSVTYRGITAKRTSDGRYIADISQQSAVNTLFNNTGVADFYLINTTTQSFYLPKTARFIQYTTSTNSVNQFNDNGLPSLQQTIKATTASNGAHTHQRGSMDITGYIRSLAAQDNATDIGGGGAFTSYRSGTYGGYGTGKKNLIDAVNFQASKSWTGSTSSNGAHTHTITITNTIGNQIYGRSSVVQPAASLKLLYYRVGDTAI